LQGVKEPRRAGGNGCPSADLDLTNTFTTKRAKPQNEDPGAAWTATKAASRSVAGRKPRFSSDLLCCRERSRSDVNLARDAAHPTLPHNE
jgi:hypothetical protein